MNRKVFAYALIIGTLALATVGGVALYRSAMAASPIFSALTTPAAPLTGKGGGMREWGMGPKGEGNDQDLATALGITTDELTAAYQKANEAALAKAVTDGLITQAQADQIKADGQAFPFGGRWMGWLKQQGVDYEALLADALGITTEKLQSAYTQAFDARIDQAVTDGKLTQDQADLMKGQRALSASQSFKSAMQTAFETAVKQAVSDGVITQAQADLILQAADKKGFGMGMPFMGGPGLGEGGMMRGGHDGGQPFAPGSGQNPSNPNGGGQTSLYPSSGTPATNY
jgi:hypothetical protein